MFCLCKKCVFLAVDKKIDITRIPLVEVFAQQSDFGELSEMKTEVQCLQEITIYLSEEIVKLEKSRKDKEKEMLKLKEETEKYEKEMEYLRKRQEKISTDEFKDSLQKLEKPLQSTVEKFKEFQKLLIDDVGISLGILHTCKICMCPKDNWISFGCGHVFCKDCASLKSDKCAFCSRPVDFWHEVFLP